MMLSKNLLNDLISPILYYCNYCLLRKIISIQCLAFLGLLGALDPLGGSAEVRASDEVLSVDPSHIPVQKGFVYRLEMVHFSTPRRVSVGAQTSEFSSVIEVQVKGRGLEGMALTPVIYLNGFKTMRTHVTSDGEFLRGWLYGVSRTQLEAAAQVQGEWSLLLAPRPGKRPSIRVSPHPTGDHPGERPVIHVSRR